MLRIMVESEEGISTMLRDIVKERHETPPVSTKHLLYMREIVIDGLSSPSCPGTDRHRRCLLAFCAASSGSEAGDEADPRGEIARLRARVAELETALVRKDLLLRDTNHRAKNAFATMSSLIALELADVRDAQAREILELTQERLGAVALVHQMLQGKDDGATLDLGALLRQLGEALAVSMGAEERGIEIRIHAESAPVDAGTATSLALIANELTTNAFKYAFPDRAGGCIELSLRRRAGHLVLRVRDDGVGTPDCQRAGGTGLTLVNALAAQTGARLRFAKTRLGTAAVVRLRAR